MTKTQKEIIHTMRRAVCSYTQIAEKTGLSVGAIKSYCYRNGLNTASLKNRSGFCKNCGKPILNPSKTRPRKFCSDACKTAWWNFLGYDKGKNGKPVINEKEAEIVRLIYRLFIQGKTASGICKHLDGLGIPTPTGRKAWNQTTINSILRNEKYKGDALLQKKFTVDFLTKKQKVNEGEIPQYYVEDNHPAIIDPLEFDMVQAEIARRQKLGRSYSGASIFSSKVICGECGSFYGQKIWHSNDPYRKVVWRCNRKFNGRYVCETPTLDADEIKEKFIIAYNQLLGNRKELLEACELMCEEVGDCSALNAEIDKLNEEIEEVTETVNRFVKENASTRLSQESYDQKYNSLVKKGLKKPTNGFLR